MMAILKTTCMGVHCIHNAIGIICVWLDEVRKVHGMMYEMVVWL